jgi:transcriptional regulator with XRE-family HTH domain
MKYPNNIKALKKAKGWTIDQAAAAMGMSRGGYIKVERGENRLTSTSIANAARAFGVSESEIVSSAVRKQASTASSEAGAPPVPPPEHSAPATLGIASKDIPRTQEQLEIFESRIVREAVEVTARKVYSTVKETLPTDDVFQLLVGFSLKEYADLKDQRLELAKVADQTRLEGEGRTSGKPTARGPKAR